MKTFQQFQILEKQEKNGLQRVSATGELDTLAKLYRGKSCILCL